MEKVQGNDLALTSGSADTPSELLPFVYEQLRHLAAARLAREKPGQTLQPTALVHEAWLRVRGSNGEHWDSRGHFFAAAAQAMRRIMVERARRKHTEKREGTVESMPLDDFPIASPLPDDELLAIDEALGQLALVDAMAAKLVDLRFFAGLTQVEAAAELGVSRSTADRLWRFARAWLFSRIRPVAAENSAE